MSRERIKGIRAQFSSIVRERWSKSLGDEVSAKAANNKRDVGKSAQTNEVDS